MRIAVIDLGTNTFNLVIADISESLEILVNTKSAVKLGEGGIEKNFITDKAIERAIQTLYDFKSLCIQNQVKKIVALGTSAIRNAKNQAQFIEKIYAVTQIPIHVIDGNREAELIYRGVSLGVNLSTTPSLIMDIGGGSTEFIIATSRQVLWKKSFELGAARLLEKFKLSDPITQPEIKNIIDYLSSKLEEVEKMCLTHQVTELIGSSGSFDTFAEVIQHRLNDPINLENQTEYTFSLSEFKSTYEILCKSTFEERLITKGIIPIRAEMIVVSGILTNFIIDMCSITKMRLSTYALKEGVLSELIDNAIQNRC